MTRKEAIKILTEIQTKHKKYIGQIECNNALNMAIEALQAEPKQGEWIKDTLFGLGVEKYHGFKCSVCNEHTGDITNYCPNCGAKMDGGKEREVKE